MTNLADGVYTAPQAQLIATGLIFPGAPSTVRIEKIAKYAGAAVGSAVVNFPLVFAQDAEPEMGTEARLTIDYKTVFRGVIGQGPFRVGGDVDEVQLVLFDDKWSMQANIVGQYGIGTQGDPVGSTGFKDVGFEVVFNRDGKPNKDPSSLEFNTGSTAVLWSLADIMRFIWIYYVDSDVATLSASQLGTAYSLRYPSDLNLVGQNALQATDTIAQLSGESWGLKAAVSASTFVAVAPGSGTQRTVWMFAPKTGAQATDAGEYHASDVSVETSIVNAIDRYQAISAHALKETTISNTGDTPLLVIDADFTDKEFAARFSVDVTAYTDNSLGGNLSAGSKPKPWKKHLLTRLNADGDAYLTAAAIAATPALAYNAQIAKPLVWVSPTSTDIDDARLCVGGMQVDVEHGTIAFKATVDLMADTGDDPEEVSVSDWSAAGIWMTVVTELATPVTVESSADETYLPETRYAVIRKDDLVPELRRNTMLADHAGNNNAITTLAVAATEEDPDETYIDVTDRLTEAAEAALEATPAIETPITVSFPFLPLFEIGDRVRVTGRPLSLSGNEVVTSIQYDISESYETQVKATNVLAGVDPDQFLEVE